MELEDVDPIVIENVWIPMSDGVNLAAKIWLPPDAEKTPVPAILEYIPYRKRDIKAMRDANNHGFFTRHGYAGVRVDLRGSGDSGGVLFDEYLEQELQDGLEVIDWIAKQPWCSGKVGLFGLSWGGFNGLQIATLRPPALGAIITVCSSDDRYQDDVHYMGGCLLTDNLSWAATMFAYNSSPPDPQIVGKRWREMWLERLQHSGLWIKNWLEHQRRDDFWKHASVCEDYNQIQVPVLTVSGWADGYSNSVFRLLEHLDVPRKGLIGPWGHKYPHMNNLGTSIDFLGECIRWWDRWLKGIENGVDQEPMLRVWMQDTADPLENKRPGRWVAEGTYPSPHVTEKMFYVAPHTLSENPLPDVIHHEQTLLSPLSVGLFAGKWCSYSESTDLPWDQREEDGGALVYDTAPLEEDVEILGAAVVELELCSEKPIAMIAARLTDIAPNDRATRVAYGLLNLTHRDSHENPIPLEPGKRYNVRLALNSVAQRFVKGNRIRLALSTSYWPLAWPSPEPARLTVYPHNCRLYLPTRPPRPKDGQLRDLGKPRAARGIASTMLAPAEREWTVSHDLAHNRVALNVIDNAPVLRLDEIDLVVTRNMRETYTYSHNNYDTVRGEVVGERAFDRDDWHVRTITRTVLTSSKTHFIIRATIDAYEDDVRIYSNSWDESIPRDMV